MNLAIKIFLASLISVWVLTHASESFKEDDDFYVVVASASTVFATLAIVSLFYIVFNMNWTEVLL